MQELLQIMEALYLGENCLLTSYWHRDIVSLGLLEPLKSFMVVIMTLSTNSVSLYPCLSWISMIPHSFRKVSFIYPILDLHVAGIACKPGDAYSSGAPGLASMLEVHVYPPFLSFSRPTDYANGLTLGNIVVYIFK